MRGTDWCVTQPFPAGGLGGAVAPPAGSGAEPRRQTHLGTNVLKIMIRSLFGRRLYPEFRSNKRRSLAATTQDSQCCAGL